MVNTDEHNNKYCNGKIYKITDLGYNECYVGSTVQKLPSRMGGHRRTFKRYTDGKKEGFCSSFLLFETYGADCLKIELIEQVRCNNKEELRRHEGEWIQRLECVNKRVAGQTPQEWRKKYYDANREKLLESFRMYNMNNKDKIGEQRNKHRKENNYNESRKEKTTCEVCGSCFRKWDNNRHERSKKHQNAVA